MLEPTITGTSPPSIVGRVDVEDPTANAVSDARVCIATTVCALPLPSVIDDPSPSVCPESTKPESDSMVIVLLPMLITCGASKLAVEAGERCSNSSGLVLLARYLVVCPSVVVCEPRAVLHDVLVG